MKNNAFFGPYSRRRFSNYSLDDPHNKDVSQSVRFTLSVESGNHSMGSASIRLIALGPQPDEPSYPIVGDRGGATTYPAGTKFRAIATSYSGYEFVRWESNIGSEINPNSNIVDFELRHNTSLVAQFKKQPTAQGNKTLTVHWNGEMGRVTCDSNAFTLDSGAPANSGSITASGDTSVKLTAEPKDGFRFVRWDGINIKSKGAQTITVNVSNITITAVFEAENTGGGEEPGGGENPGGGGEDMPYPGDSNKEVFSLDTVTALLKKWWWVLLILAFLYFDSKKGGSK